MASLQSQTLKLSCLNPQPCLFTDVKYFQPLPHTLVLSWLPISAPEAANSFQFYRYSMDMYRLRGGLSSMSSQYSSEPVSSLSSLQSIRQRNIPDIAESHFLLKNKDWFGNWLQSAGISLTLKIFQMSIGGFLRLSQLSLPHLERV